MAGNPYFLTDGDSIIPGATRYPQPSGFQAPVASPLTTGGGDLSLLPAAPSYGAPKPSPWQLELTPEFRPLPRQDAPLTLPGLGIVAPTPGQLIAPGSSFALSTGRDPTAPKPTSTQMDAAARREREASAGDSPWGGLGRLFGGSAPAASAPAAPSTPAGPVAPGAVLTGGGGGGGGVPPALSEEQMTRMTRGEIEAYNFRRARIANELNKRATPGAVVKGGKVPTGESYAGQVGASAPTTARYDAARADSQLLDKRQADVEADIGDVARETNAKSAGIEAAHARRMEELEKRRQEAVGAATADIDKANKEVQEGKYEPDRVWNHASSGQKAVTLISALLAGVGQGLAGKGFEENVVFKSLRQVVENDNINQQQVLKLKGEKLNVAQRVYKDTLERYGSEAAAQSAAKLVKLNALQVQLAATAEGMRANAKVGERVTGIDGKTYEGPSVLSLRAERAKAAIEEERAKEKFNLEREINGTVQRSFGYTQDRVVGGSAGPDANKIQGWLDENAKTERGAVPKDGQGKAVFMGGGEGVNADPRASQGTVDKAQGMVNFANQGLATAEAIERRASQPGGLVPGDPALALAADNLGSALANASGSNVPSESQLKLAHDATTPGPRQPAALDEARRQFRQGKQIAVESVGGARR